MRDLNKSASEAIKIEDLVILNEANILKKAKLSISKNEDKLKAMQIALVSLCENFSKEFGKGAIEQLYIKSVNGSIMLEA